MERDAKAGNNLPEEGQGDGPSRLEAPKEPREDPEKRRVVEKQQEDDS